MLVSILIFIAGSLFLLISTWYFIKLTEHVSIALKLSPLVIGLTVVSIGTSLPELAISSIAAYRGDVGLATGNIIGSNIVNVFLVFAVGILSGKLRIGTTKTQRNIFILCGVTGLFLLFYFFKIPNLVAGSILLFLTLFITLIEYFWGTGGRKHEDAVLFKKKSNYSLKVFDVFKLLISLAGVVIGGILTVMSTEQLAVLLGLSTTILGLSTTAIVTSLPELLTTIFSQKDHEAKMTIGNIIGSNIYNLTLVGGIVLSVSTSLTLITYEMFMLILATFSITAIIIAYSGKVIPKTIGYLLLGLFVIYIYFLR